MNIRKSLTGKVNFDIEYALNPIASFGEYVDRIAGIWAIREGDSVSKSHILISGNGEYVSDRSNSDYSMEFSNTKMLMDESVAKEVSKKMGYLFFPSGEIVNNKFYREFGLEDFVGGAVGILDNIDRETTHNGESYREFVANGIIKMKRDSKYFDNKAALKYDINSHNVRLVVGLNPEYIGGFEGYSTKGFNGAWATMDFDSSYNSDGFFNSNRFHAQFSPHNIDENFSEQDLSDISEVIRNISGRNKNASKICGNGYVEEVSLEMNDENKSLLDLGLCMYGVADCTRVLSASEMVGPFTKYIHVVHNGLRVIADTKKNKRNDRIAELENAIGVFNK
jgi:hypothetical protein